MRSIFARILLWTVGTTIVSLVGFAVTTRLIWEKQPGPVDLIGRFQSLILEDAQTAYRQGGRERLAAYLRRLDERLEATHFLVDATGNNLVDGRDLSVELKNAGIFPGPPRNYDGAHYAVSPPSAEPRLLIRLDRKFPFMGFLPYYLWIFLVIAALGYALAMYLGRPLVELRRAVERFGRGDLSTRTRSTRRDEIGELARAFDRMAERTESLMTAQRRLLQDVSHELRSPLARLKLTVRLAKNSGDRPLALERIKKEADRLSELVDELLEVAAAEEDPQALDQHEVRLDSLLAELVDDSATEANVKDCRLELIDHEPARVMGDRELLRRAVENVLRNAIRHAPEGTAIDLGVRRVGGIVTLWVRDRGPGVPEESLQSIFEPFYRVGPDRSRSGGGVGLGLSISRRAIELHGGEISTKNESPGLSVTIRLPALELESLSKEKSQPIDPARV
jgi:two-component system sensor histidine kinase CpxA